MKYEIKRDHFVVNISILTSFCLPKTFNLLKKDSKKIVLVKKGYCKRLMKPYFFILRSNS